MDLETAINHPDVNVFDIINDVATKLGWRVYTHPKPGEREDQYFDRCRKNFKKALELKTKSPK